jgi:hypothetical protein
MGARWKASPRVIVLVGIDHGEFATILRRLVAIFDERPEPAAWQDLTLVLGR